jgi:hypothetical protein
MYAVERAQQALADGMTLLNRGQRRYTGLERLNPYNGRVTIGADEMFPFLPSVGVTAEF